MNILVTGAGGFIGGRVVEHLGKAHNKVYGLIHDKQSWADGWTPINGDVKSYPRLLEIMADHGIQRVYHFAAKSIVRNCNSDPIGCFHANVLGTVNVLEAARQVDTVTGVLCAESDKTYGAGPVPYREDQALRPGGIYEASKACVTYAARAYYENYGFPVFTVRSANVYGPGDENMTRVVPNTITRLLQSKLPQITTGANKFIREFFYIDDFVTTVVGLMDKSPWGEAFNVGSGEMFSITEVIQIICELMDRKLSTAEWNKPASLLEIPEQSLCLDKLNRWLPDRELLPLRVGLLRTIEWHRDRR